MGAIYLTIVFGVAAVLVTRVLGVNYPVDIYLTLLITVICIPTIEKLCNAHSR